MAEVIRFRPVLFGPPERPTDVLWVKEEPDGEVVFRALDFPWSLDVPLDAVTVADLPSPYRGRYRDQTFPVTILPTQEVSGSTRAEAFERMLEAIRTVRTKGATTLRESA